MPPDFDLYGGGDLSSETHLGVSDCVLSSDMALLSGLRSWKRLCEGGWGPCRHGHGRGELTLGFRSSGSTLMTVAVLLVLCIYAAAYLGVGRAPCAWRLEFQRLLIDRPH